MSERLNDIRWATMADAPAIAAVHVAAWRSAYPGLLPAQYLAKLSVLRQAAFYERAIRLGGGVQVATLARRIVGFSTARRTQGNPLGDGEIETLYVLDDARDQGFGRRLMRASAAHLSELGCNSAFAWVLRDNQASFSMSISAASAPPIPSPASAAAIFRKLPLPGTRSIRYSPKLAAGSSGLAGSLITTGPPKNRCLSTAIT